MSADSNKSRFMLLKGSHENYVDKRYGADVSMPLEKYQIPAQNYHYSFYLFPQSKTLN